MNETNGVSISILIATRNRAAALTRTLDSLFTASNLSRRDWEVIVADNGSSDGTAEVCRTFQEGYSDQFRFILESRGGKSCALNAGIPLCRGEVLALIDDDVICEACYLDAVRDSLAENKECVVQGRVFVDYDGALPAWFDEYFETMLCRIDLGNEICDLRRPRQLWGLNGVLPAESIARVGGFCPELGPGASGYADDVEFSRRLRRAGYRFIYDPRIVVRHQISSHRLKARYVLKRAYAMGVSPAYYEHVPQVSLWRYTVYIAKGTLLSLPRLFLGLSSAKRNLAMQVACEQLTSIGFVCQHWRFRVSGRPKLTAPKIDLPRFRGEAPSGAASSNR